MKFICQIFIKFSLVLGMMLFISCGSKTTTTVTQKKVRSGLDKYNNGYDLSKGEHGMMQSKSTKKSHYDNLRASALGGSVAKTDYTKSSYRSQRWGGDSRYSKKDYSGSGSYNKTAYNTSENTSFEKGYITNSSRFGGQTYGTSGSTVERRAGYVKTGSSGYVDSMSNAAEPTIISRDEYNQLGVQQSNNLLGR